MLTHATVGNILDAVHKPEQAKQWCEKALLPAKTIAPEFQMSWIPRLEEKLKPK